VHTTTLEKLDDCAGSAYTQFAVDWLGAIAPEAVADPVLTHARTRGNQSNEENRVYR